jgi:glycosyltransferase involved in cell wall biosynthesis
MVSSKPLVSIILPVYNGEKFLRGAVESVLAQSCQDWELLLVDDGSNDGSSAICDEYADQDERIKVFHQPNGGVNSARAKGIENTKGGFLAFLDADDAMMPDAIDYMIGLMQDGIDLAARGRTDTTIDKEAYLKALWKGQTGPELWGKMFRTSLFRQTEYKLERRMAMGEDLLLNSIYALNIRSAHLFTKDVYSVNRGNEASVTRTFKHNWEYEKYYFSKVEELFLSRCTGLASYDRIKLLVGKSWLNAMKYVMLDGGSINYGDPEFKAVKAYFKERKEELGPSERMLLSVRNSALYRLLLKSFLSLKKN